MAEELILYADESVETGRYFSNFYGGCLVSSKDLKPVVNELDACKSRLNLHGEVKWQKVTKAYLGKYQELMAVFFSHVAAGRLKVRVMFTQNMHVPTGLTQEQRDQAYFLLYYQFVKHAFGLRYAALAEGGANLRIYLDDRPDTYEKRALFRSHLANLTRSPELRRIGLRVDPNQIADVDSHDHVLLQCTDVVLGAMQFRLNDKHLEKSGPRRGSRTIAKERLYKAILRHVRALHPNFNIGISTGVSGDATNRWRHPYRHWKFVPGQHTIDPTRTKRTRE